MGLQWSHRLLDSSITKPHGSYIGCTYVIAIYIYISLYIYILQVCVCACVDDTFFDVLTLNCLRKPCNILQSNSLHYSLQWFKNHYIIQWRMSRFKKSHEPFFSQSLHQTPASRNFRMSRLCSPKPPWTPLIRLQPQAASGYLSQLGGESPKLESDTSTCSGPSPGGFHEVCQHFVESRGKKTYSFSSFWIKASDIAAAAPSMWGVFLV